MISVILISLLCAIAGISIRYILTEPGMILWPLYNLVVNKWKFPEWITKPLFDCAYCIAGQWALWCFLYLRWNNYNPVYHLLCITTAVFIVDIIKTNFKYE